MRNNNKVICLMLVAIGGCLLAGCQRFQVPAIDKTGERIFAPQGNSTSLQPWSCPLWPKPAFVAGPTPPPCPDECPVPATPAPFAAAPPAPRPSIFPDCKLLDWFKQRSPGQLIVAPARIVAPVGSEVILTAGVADERGQLVAGQDIEWVLGQESVGNFVEVGKSSRWFSHGWLHKSAGKTDNDFAASKTSSSTQHITRGTETPNDDAWIQRGQAWISVTSSTAGTSTVSVQAPDVKAWDRRRQTATIHWLDAQWRFPPTAVIPAGQEHTLETVVTQATTGQPLAGWTVRYEIVGTDAAAGFAPTGGTVAAATTDNLGRAAVQIAPKANQFGSTQIRMQIIRPATGPGDVSGLVVGQGWTTVTWSAPGLAIQVTGPSQAGIDTNVNYQVIVSNPGDMPANNVVLTDTLSAGLEFVSSQPAGSAFGDRREWRFDSIAPKTSHAIQVTCKTIARGVQQYCINGQGEGVTSSHCAQTEVIQPAIGLQITGPAEANVGDRIEFVVAITNHGSEPLTTVHMTDVFDAGLRHVGGVDSPIENTLDDPIPPGMTADIPLEFEVVGSGTLCHTMKIRADGGHTAEARKCVVVAAPQPVDRPQVDIQINGPADQKVGDLVHYTVKVTNTGNIDVTNLRVDFTFPASMFPKNATDTHDWDNGKLFWDKLMPRLQPGQSGQTIDVYVECLREDPAAQLTAAVSSAEGVTDSASTQTRITAGGADPVEPNPPNQPVAGDMKITIAELGDPITVGGKGKYVVTVTNDRNVSDRRVVINIAVTKEMKLVTFASRGGRRVERNLAHPDENGGNWQLNEIAEMRAGESVSFTVETVGVLAGPAMFLVHVESLREGAGQDAQEVTTVNAN